MKIKRKWSTFNLIDASSQKGSGEKIYLFYSPSPVTPVNYVQNTNWIQKSDSRFTCDVFWHLLTSSYYVFPWCVPKTWTHRGVWVLLTDRLLQKTLSHKHLYFYLKTRRIKLQNVKYLYTGDIFTLIENP